MWSRFIPKVSGRFFEVCIMNEWRLASKEERVLN